ncbi:hypothetical protein Y032_0001g484 [Ancylostoma ceylanicum]|uniref:Uncharacterized protein n=1 Tax=Ancylostoma ceylanicum TaxID=53326 RepID=A0A016W4V1_9BILA|nr:hypothetical protein Y032_0001g484 [Ancylostoma ceylanicum]
MSNSKYLNRKTLRTVDHSECNQKALSRLGPTTTADTVLGWSGRVGETMAAGVLSLRNLAPVATQSCERVDKALLDYRFRVGRATIRYPDRNDRSGQRPRLCGQEAKEAEVKRCLKDRSKMFSAAVLPIPAGLAHRDSSRMDLCREWIGGTQQKVGKTAAEIRKDHSSYSEKT